MTREDTLQPPAASGALWRAVLKLSVSVVVIAYLAVDVVRDPSFRALFANSRGLPFFALSLVPTSLMLVLGSGRWYVLCRSIGVPAAFGMTLRATFVSSLLGLSPVGMLGGDVSRNLMLARATGASMDQVLSSVVADRVFGVVGLLVTSGVSLMLVDVPGADSGRFRAIGAAVLLAAMLATLAVLWKRDDPGRGASSPPSGRLASAAYGMRVALARYRSRPEVCALATGTSVLAHSLGILAAFLVLSGFLGAGPSLGRHFVITSASQLARLVPLPFGPFEASMEVLYGALSSGLPRGIGLVTALGFRASVLVASALGAAALGALGSSSRALPRAPSP